MNTKNLRWLWLSVLIVLLDYGTKAWVSSALNPGQSIPLIPHLNLVLFYNQGAAFSFLSTLGLWKMFSAISLIVSLAILAVFVMGKIQRRSTAISLSLILGGAVGNLINRILPPHHVVDFIDFYIGSWHWPAFNVADSAVCVGAVLMIISQWGEQKK